MLSEKRREILKKNRNTIKALHLRTLSEKDKADWFNFNTTCEYTYPDGRHCAVGACLTEEELEKVKKEGLNNAGVRGLLRVVYFSDEEVDTLISLQNCHDGCCGQMQMEPLYNRFEAMLNKVIETGETV